MTGIFELVGGIITDLFTGVALESGSAVRSLRRVQPRDSEPLPIGLPETIDEATVVAAYRRHLGEGADFGERLLYGPMTPIALVAVVGDFAMIASIFALVLTVSRIPTPWEFSIFGITLAIVATLALRLSRPDLESPSSGGRDGLPIGVLTGLLLRTRRQARAKALASGPFSADDPLVIGPVVRDWSVPLLNRAEPLLRDPSSARVARVARLGADPEASRSLHEAAIRAEALLDQAVRAMRALVADPASIHRSPLVATQETFAELRSALEQSERIDAEILALRRTVPPHGSLEEPIRLNAPG